MKTSTFIIALTSGIIVTGALVLLAKNIDEKQDLDHLYFDENPEDEITYHRGIKTKQYNTDNLFI